MRRTASSASTLLLALLLSIDAKAEPLDLLDSTPRAVEVAFEVSPRDKPTQTDAIYSPRLLAFFEPGEDRGTVRIIIDRRDVEQVLLAADDPVPGSFSDFVWTLDAATGAVLRTELTGRVVKELDWGWFRSDAEAAIAVDMKTGRVAGVRAPRSWLGQQLFGYCDDPNARSCQRVAGRHYDRETGYVYAVGALEVRYGRVTLRTFSPLGEAVFAELGDEPAPGSQFSAALPPVAAPPPGP